MEVPAGECFVCWYTELFHRTLCLKRSELEVGGVPIAFKSSLGASNSGMFSTPPHLSSPILSWDHVPLGEFFLILYTFSFSSLLSPKLSPSTPSCWSGMKWNAFCSFFSPKEENYLCLPKTFKNLNPTTNYPTSALSQTWARTRQVLSADSRKALSTLGTPRGYMSHHPINRLHPVLQDSRRRPHRPHLLRPTKR